MNFTFILSSGVECLNPPPTIENTTSVTSGSTFGDTVNVTCLPGHMFPDNGTGEVLECLAAGNVGYWSPSAFNACAGEIHVIYRIHT